MLNSEKSNYQGKIKSVKEKKECTRFIFEKKKNKHEKNKDK